MMKYANIFRCCILPTVPRYIQEISKKIELFFGKKAILWLPSVVSLIPEPLIPLNAPASSEAGFAATSPVHQKANSEGYSVYLSLPVAFTKSCSPKYDI